MLHAALRLAEKGMRVFPVQPRSKVPATLHGCKDATTGVDLIRQWWEHEPLYNIGIACGAPSGIIVVDVDGASAEAELRKLETRHGESLPVTAEVATARGRHLYFKAPGVPVRNSAGKIAPGIDVRGDGGYVLGPPSIHPSGKTYRWSANGAVAIADAPAWLPAGVVGRANSQVTPRAVWRALVRDGVGEGARDSSCARLAGHLLHHLIDPIVVLGLLQAWNATRCAPPLPPEDIDRIVNSIAGRELARRDGRG